MTLMKVSTNDEVQDLKSQIVLLAVQYAKLPITTSVKPLPPELLALFDRLAELGRTLRS